MTVVGGSHTNFDTAGFSAGAMTGAGLVAASLAAGVANLRRQRKGFARLNYDQLLAALMLSEGLREHEHELNVERAAAAKRRIQALELETERVKSRLKLALVRR